MKTFSNGVWAGCVSTLLFVLVLHVYVAAFSPSAERRMQLDLSDRYCTDFAPAFQLNANGTWECLEENK